MTDPLRPLRLSNGLFLNAQISLRREDTNDGPRWKVRQSRYQYQADDASMTNDWVFRYDYLRPPNPDANHPSAHLNVNAEPALTDVVPGRKKKFPDIHFPTRRMSFERVIALLADDFDVPCAIDRSEWIQLLAESEGEFLKIAHDPTLPPEELPS